MLNISKKHIKSRNFRISNCGDFPNYSLNGFLFNNRNLIYLVSVGKEKFEYKWVDKYQPLFSNFHQSNIDYKLINCETLKKDKDQRICSSLKTITKRGNFYSSTIYAALKNRQDG